MTHFHKLKPVRGAVRHALYAGTVLALAAQAPVAQAQDDESLDEVTVTGSRLIRQDYVAISPITTVDSAIIQDSGNPTLEETLNMYPQLNPDSTSASNQSGGDGILAPDLRGFGAVRTLLPVDGKRFIPGSVTGLSDMALIPDMLIERVDVRYQWGEASEGDATTNKIDFVFGANTEDGSGNITLVASYTERDPVFMFTTRSDAGTSSVHASASVHAEVHDQATELTI